MTACGGGSSSPAPAAAPAAPEPAPEPQPAPILPTTLSVSRSALALAAQNLAALPTPVPGHPRTLTVLNTGSQPALALSMDVAGFPAGTLISANSCSGTLAAAASCSITITPGSVPTTVPVTLTVQASNSNTVSTSVEVLAYGSLYQGGHVFALDDGTAPSVSVGGKVLAVSSPIVGNTFWSSDTSLIAGIDETSTSPCAGATDGACNTATIVAHHDTLGMGRLTHAAGQCVSFDAESFTDWYLPAACEVSYGGYRCGTVTAPTAQNIRSNLVELSNVGSFAGFYWTSTTDQLAPAGNVWTVMMQAGVPPFHLAMDKRGSASRMRCVRQLTQ